MTGSQLVRRRFVWITGSGLFLVSQQLSAQSRAKACAFDTADAALSLPAVVFIRPGVRSPSLAAIEQATAFIAAAVRRRDSLGPLPAADWRGQVLSGPLRVEIVIGAGLPNGAIPLMATRIPVLRADTDVTPLNFAKPRYPSESQQRSEAATVEVRYPVNEEGRVERGTIEVVYVEVDADRPAPSVARSFAESAVDAIAKSRFHPARVRGCPVPALVHQRVNFRIGGT